MGIWLLIPASTAGCDTRGCVCNEVLAATRTVEEPLQKKTLTLGNPQTGEARIEMHIPPSMNASACVC